MDIIQVYIFIFISLLIAYIGYIFNIRGKSKFTFIIIIISILSIVCAFKPINILYDADTYVSFFNNPYLFSYEPLFQLITLYIKSIISDYKTYFFIIAFIGLLFKIISIFKYSISFWLSIITLICILFPLQDFVQIRIAIASGFLLYSTKYIINKKKIHFFVCILIASMFHYSAFCWTILFFLNTKKISIYKWSIIYILSFVLAYTNIFEYIKLIPIDFFQEKIETYNKIKQEGSMGEINLFGGRQLLQSFIGFLLLYKSSLNTNDQLFVTLTKIYMCSIITFVLFSNNYVLSTRISEVFLIVSVLLFPYIIKYFKNKVIGNLIFFSYNIIYLYFLLFIQGVINK